MVAPIVAPMLHQPPESFNVLSLLSIDHEQQVSDDLCQRFSHEELGSEADQTEGENE
jgi:hypothetical protein